MNCARVGCVFVIALLCVITGCGDCAEGRAAAGEKDARQAGFRRSR